MVYPGEVETERLEKETPPPLAACTAIGTVAYPTATKDSLGNSCLDWKRSHWVISET